MIDLNGKSDTDKTLAALVQEVQKLRYEVAQLTQRQGMSINLTGTLTPDQVQALISFPNAPDDNPTP